MRQYLTKEWLPAVKATIRPSTYNSYVQHVECHIAPHIGSVKLAKLSGSQVNALYAKLAETGPKDGKNGLSAMTIHHVHSCLHKACKDAVRWGHISRNPLDAADPPRKKGDGTREMRTWTKEQLKAFLEAVSDDRLSPLWHTIAMTGMRRGEALGLRWADVDLENARLSVRRALIPTNREVVVSEPKTAKGRRVVALDPVTVEVLKAQAARQLDEQTGVGRGLGRDRPRVHGRERRRPRPGVSLALLAPGGEEGDAADDPPARPAPHARHPGPAGRRPPQGRQ